MSFWNILGAYSLYKFLFGSHTSHVKRPTDRYGDSQAIGRRIDELEERLSELDYDDDMYDELDDELEQLYDDLDDYDDDCY